MDGSSRSSSLQQTQQSPSYEDFTCVDAPEDSVTDEFVFVNQFDSKQWVGKLLPDRPAPHSTAAVDPTLAPKAKEQARVEQHYNTALAIKKLFSEEEKILQHTKPSFKEKGFEILAKIGLKERPTKPTATLTERAAKQLVDRGVITQEQADDYIHLDESAYKIQVFHRNFAHRRLQKIKEQRTNLHKKLGTVQMYYQSKKNPSVKATYTFDIEEKLPPVRTISSVPESRPSGGSKRVDGMDSEYIQLTDLSYFRNKLKHQTELINVYRSHAENPIICKAMPIDEHSTIGVYGGRDLHSQPQILPIVSFWGICETVEQAHSHQEYFNDIKSANMVHRSHLKGLHSDIKLDMPQVKLIDLDEYTTSKMDLPAKASGSPFYITSSLLDKKKSGDLEAWQSADNYALLISLMESTSAEAARGINLFKKQHTQRVKRYRQEMVPRAGILSAQDPTPFVAWAKQFVLPQYQTQVIQFLVNPSEHPLDESVKQIINWNAASTK
ncbi:hypothetical protein D5R81_17395 [Parashewanella spongiae]|uniref:Uncharacterized protein n=1 Tax=Parashewanella spongiae TaxID=342950 RepID=A0A3A6TP72_9GAMM|nr:hypothetical protein [Parashewanella spongiae]MCL1079858.1 hypothetical protein [Parashewanella spongiae]RJY06767.1 hypothetical protein D5R81_17395 [Parashewanella spongiae]